MLPAKKHCHPHSASNQGHCESSIAQFLKQITLSADFLPADTQKHPSSHGNPQKEGCWTHYPVVIPITAYSHQQSRYQPLFSTAPQALLSVELWLAVLSEVLNGTDHLRGVGVLVVVPRHDLNLIGVVVATLNFHDFFVIVHNFETTVTVPQHTVVVPKPACSYQNYTTFQRYFQVLSQFCNLFFYTSFRIRFSCGIVLLLGASGTRGYRRGVRPAQMRSSGWMWWRVELRVDGLALAMGLFLIFEGYFWSDWSCFDVQTDLTTSYLWCSLLFICPVTTLPVLSPAVHLL